MPDVAMAVDSSTFGWPNETSSEASSSGNCLLDFDYTLVCNLRFRFWKTIYSYTDFNKFFTGIYFFLRKSKISLTCMLSIHIVESK
jgi:hypothetical protein